jgi:hypothetical protein
MTVEFLTCNEARISYDIPSLALAGEILAQRIVEDNVALCEALR